MAREKKLVIILPRPFAYNHVYMLVIHGWLRVALQAASI